jgi:hypothetical protein
VSTEDTLHGLPERRPGFPKKAFSQQPVADPSARRRPAADYSSRCLMSPADVADDIPPPNELPAHLHRSGWTVALRDLHRRHYLNGVEGEVHTTPRVLQSASLAVRPMWPRGIFSNCCRRSLLDSSASRAASCRAALARSLHSPIARCVRHRLPRTRAPRRSCCRTAARSQVRHASHIWLRSTAC